MTDKQKCGQDRDIEKGIPRNESGPKRLAFAPLRKDRKSSHGKAHG